MSLFQKSVEKKYLNELDSALIDRKYKAFQVYFGNPSIQENIRNSKEEQFQEGFLRELFVAIFGYTLNPQTDFNLTTELKNIVNSKKADGAILKGDDALAVIELKGTDTTDLDKIEAQAFGYKNHHPKCVYVITSNFEKLRFYIQNAVDHIDFDLFNLSREQFTLMWLCLAKDNLLSGLPQKIKESSLLQEENITKKLYADYSKFREAIYNNLVKNNPETDKLLLFKKTQKLLDRFLFIFFAEDRLLLPPNSISEIVKQWTNLKDEYDEYFTLYSRFKKYFGYMNSGYKGRKYEIYAYNGGLFAPDEILDNISIDDDILHKHTLTLSNYDFETDVDVNILGHIFEHSLGEIENVQAEIKGEKIDKQKTRRKKDGIFYTPKYITKYIVENTIGKLCEEKRIELNIVDEEYAKGRRNRKKDTVKSLDNKLTDYRNWLLSLTILDPACGSGAFLNQALEFLINEHRKIDELRGQLLDSAIIFSDITTDILEKNIYGVDLNEESVEIAKLSLWLRTAQKGRKLNKLNNNIKCGNSLIDDPAVAGDKAFNWQNEFPEIFKNGGFDVVIGNPPYLGGQFLKRQKVEYDFILKNYTVAEYQFDLYILFFELALKLSKVGGFISYISPNTWLTNISNKPLRKYLLENSTIDRIVDYSSISVFKDAVVLTAIIVLHKSQKSNPIVKIFDPDNFINPKFNIPQDTWHLDENHVFNLSLSNDDILLKNKIKTSTKRLDEIADVKFGVKIYEVGKGSPQQTREQTKARIYEADRKIDESYLPYLEGKDISSYLINWSNKWLKYGANLAAPRKKELFTGERVLVRRIMGNRLICAYTNQDIITNALLQIVKPKNQKHSKFLLLVLSSSVIAYFFRKSSDRQDIVFPEIKIHELSNLPIRTPNDIAVFDKLSDRIISQTKNIQTKKVTFLNRLKDNFCLDKISKRLESFFDFDFKTFLSELQKQKVRLTLYQQDEWEEYFNTYKSEINQIQTEIEKTDKEIDQMVYELYGLTDEEIKIVEGSL